MTARKTSSREAAADNSPPDGCLSPLRGFGVFLVPEILGLTPQAMCVSPVPGSTDWSGADVSETQLGHNQPKTPAVSSP
jgi:hypothetical protein